jgi:hypothetical protein
MEQVQRFNLQQVPNEKDIPCLSKKESLVNVALW